MTLRVFIGYDSREPEAYEVAAHTLRRHSSVPLAISALTLPRLRANGLYTRPADKTASTEFSLTRFLVPQICDFKGYALFFDCDFLWRADVDDLLGFVDMDKAVSVVKHPYYEPKLAVKMDGRAQSTYDRKNWSSLMLFNNAECQRLDHTAVNTWTPQALHRFAAFSDKEIGELPREWNWLEGEDNSSIGEPKAVHFTNGGPWFPTKRNIKYGDLWLHELNCAIAARLPNE